MMNRASLFLPLLASVALAQATHIVSGGGAALQNAINAAAPGDILDVMPGNYTAVTATRGLRISLRAGASIAAGGLPPASAITITSVPLGEAFVLEGGVVEGFDAFACAGAVVLVRSDLFRLGSSSRVDACTGPVAFQGLTSSTTPLPYGSIAITNSAAVSFASCRLGQVIVTNSAVSFADMVIPVSYGFTPGLHIVSGSVVINGGSIAGSTTASWPGTAPGVQIDQGTLVVTGGTSIAPSPAMFNLPAIQANGGTVLLDPSVQLLSTPAIGGAGSVTVAPIPSPAVVRAPGSPSYQVNVVAAPASLVFTLLGLPAPVLPLPWGDAWLDPVSPILDVTVAPGSGTWSFTRSLAGVPPFLVLVVQSAALSPHNTIALSPPVRFVWD